MFGLILVLALGITGDDIPAAQMQAIFEEGESEREADIAAAQKHLKSCKETLALAKKGQYLSGGGWTLAKFDNRRQAQTAEVQAKKDIDDALAAIAKMSDTSVPRVPLLRSFTVGLVGRIPYVATIRQKISNNEALVDVTVAGNEQLVLCRGLDLSEVFDGAGISLNRAMIVVKPYSYQSLLGQKTIPAVEPLDISKQFKAEIAKRKGR